MPAPRRTRRIQRPIDESRRDALDHLATERIDTSYPIPRPKLDPRESWLTEIYLRAAA